MTTKLDENERGEGALIEDKKQYLQTASGKITCLGRTAQSSRTKMQCDRPAIKTSKWNGPRTAEGRRRIAQAQLKHGAYAKANLRAKQAEAIQLRLLEDIAVLIGMIQGPRTRGCKPRGYRPITSMEAVKALIALK